ncbi:MAG TPA: serine hydrolase [Longimicrobium sp.]|nr:serine hydrolase [Longimicrobium sp.]
MPFAVLLRPLLVLSISLLAACDPATETRAAPRAARSTERPAAAVSAVSDSVLLAEAVRRAEALPRLRGMIVAREGEIVEERYWRGAAADRRTNVKSVSKSVLALLVGIAVAEGEVRLDQPVAELLPEHFGARADPRKRAITLEHLVSMRSGLESTSFSDYGAWVSSPNWVRYQVERPMVDHPGGRMIYSTGSSHLLSAALTRATGMSTYEYARRKLAQPLGIDLRPWQRDPQGIYFGGNEMRLTPRDMLRIGELFRNGGRHGGAQVVPKAWIEASTRPLGTSPWNGHRYGYGWWIKEARGHPVYFAWGYGGQYVFVVPGLALTAVFVSEADGPRTSGHLGAIHALLDDYLVPAAEAAAARG